MRKTLDRKRVIETANRMLAADSNRINTADARRGIIALLDAILHDHDSYKGFNYLYVSQLGPNETPGINGEPGAPLLDFEGRFCNTDNTRVFFYS